MINSRKIEDLHPVVQKMALEFIKKCKEAGIDVIITSTYRCLKSQAELYAQGRTKPGKIVTNAKPGDSYHNYQVAFDFVIVKNGICQWNDTKGFTKCGEIAESVGLTWSGRWQGKLKELVHCQYTANLTLADFKAGKRLPAV